jgi:protein TonB
MTANDDHLAQIGGWAFSVVLHGVSLGTAIVLATEFSVLPRENPFRWDVSLISAPQEELIVSDVPRTTSASSAAHPGETPLQNTAPRARPLKKADTRPMKGTMPSDRLADMPPQTDRPNQQALDDAPTIIARAASESAPPDPSTSDGPPPLVSQAAPVVFPVSTQERAETPPPDIDTTEPSTVASVPSIPESIHLVNRPSPHGRDATLSRMVHADYGWLAEMLFQQVEATKRYPSTARRNRWQGNVTLQALIHDDGQISDITIVEPSGYPTLDQDAIALLERVSPVALAYPLGQSHVVVQIPIGYRLE